MEPVIQGHTSSVSIAAGQNESCQIFHSPASTEVLLCWAALNSFFPLSEPVLGIALSQVQHLPLRAYRWRKTCVLIRALRANPSPTPFPGVPAVFKQLWYGTELYNLGAACCENSCAARNPSGHPSWGCHPRQELLSAQTCVPGPCSSWGAGSLVPSLPTCHCGCQGL